MGKREVRGISDCPFCDGSILLVEESHFTYEDGYHFECENCHIMTESHLYSDGVMDDIIMKLNLRKGKW